MSGFKAGNPGRPKGSLNKATQIISQFREKHGDQWIMEVWTLATNPTTRDADRLTALNIIGKKIFPDMKAIEHSGEIETQPERTIDLSKLETTELEVLKKVIQDKRKDQE